MSKNKSYQVVIAVYNNGKEVHEIARIPSSSFDEACSDGQALIDIMRAIKQLKRKGE